MKVTRRGGVGQGMGVFAWTSTGTDSERSGRSFREAVHFNVLRAGEAIRESNENGLLADLPRPGARAARYGLLAVAVAATLYFVVGSKSPVFFVNDEPAATAGTAGRDMLMGTSGRDTITAGRGDDVLIGGGKADALAAATGNDVLDGGAGADTLRAGAGRDVLLGGAGNDVLYANEHDGVADQLVCGPGKDIAHIVAVNGRSIDRVSGCESVHVTNITITARR